MTVVRRRMPFMSTALWNINSKNIKKIIQLYEKISWLYTIVGDGSVTDDVHQ